MDIALTLDPNKSIKSKKVIVSSSNSSRGTSNASSYNPKSKKAALEFIKEHLALCNQTMQQGEHLDEFQAKFVQGIFQSNFETPLQKMLTKEKDSKVRENAFGLLYELKKTISFTGFGEETVVSNLKAQNIDAIINKLPTKNRKKKIIEELELTETKNNGKVMYLFSSPTSHPSTQVATKEFDEMPVKIGKKGGKAQEKRELKKPTKRKVKKGYELSDKTEEYLQQAIGDDELSELKKALSMISQIEANRGIDVQAAENLLIDIEVIKPYIVECIKFTLINGISESGMESKEFMISESLTLLIQKVISLSRKTVDGETIYNMIVIMLMLSSVLPESRAHSLTNSVFTSCTAKKDDCEAFFLLIQGTLEEVYSNALGMSYQFSHWKITKIFKTLFKWMESKIDIFSISGVQFKTLQELYSKLKNILVEDNENNQNQVILVALNSFMKTLNSKMEEFHEDKESSSDENDHESENLYNFDQPSRKIQEDKYSEETKDQNSHMETMKNNFMAPDGGQEPPQASQEDDFWKEQESAEETHPLKPKLMESFEEIAKSKSKFEINQNLSFIKLILCESSVKSVEEGFYFLSSEFSRIVSILSKILKIHEVDPLAIAETFDYLKTVRIYEREVVRDEIQAKVKIMLTEFTEHMADVTEIGHTEILNEYYKLLNSYTMDLKKVEVSKILREVDYKNSEFDRISFGVHFGWLNSQILGNFFFLKDIEPLIPLLVSCFEAPEFGSDDSEQERLRQDVEKLFKQTFESFGYDQTKKSIEIMLLNDQRLYSIFFNWFYSQGFMTDERPKTAAGDFYNKEIAKEEISKSIDKKEESKDEQLSDNSDGFPDESNYKLVESRAKTIEAFYPQADVEKKLDN